jgi:hypothetical protein
MNGNTPGNKGPANWWYVLWARVRGWGAAVDEGLDAVEDGAELGDALLAAPSATA